MSQHAPRLGCARVHDDLPCRRRAGLVELGLGYAALIPGFRPSDDGTGDVLVTQWIDDLDVDTSDFVYATEAVGQLVGAVVQQVREAGSRGGVRQRRAARRAQLFAALGD